MGFRAMRTPIPLLATVGLLAAATACSTSSDGKTLHVVAAENFWGSIASQLGGTHTQVTSIINNPATDPHDYEPTAADARTVAGAQYTIVNGIGYDAWADKLLAASPSTTRTDLKIGDLVGLKPGGNPHRWYSPADVHRVIERITADYKTLTPAGASFEDWQTAQLHGI